jgi:hypothetical protein
MRMDEPGRRTSAFVNAFWGSGISVPRPTREHWRAKRWQLLGVFGVVWGLPIGVGLAIGLVAGRVLAGILAGGALLLALFFVALVVGAITEPRRARRRRSG